MDITETALIARNRDWTFEETTTLYRETFPDALRFLNKSILWADVDTSGRDSIVSYLRRRGYFMYVVNNLVDAITFIQERLPDCCLIDSAFTGFTGIDLLEALSREPLYRKTAFFLVSDAQNAQLDYENKMLQFFGGVKVLRKPLTTPELLSTLDALWPDAHGV